MNVRASVKVELGGLRSRRQGVRQQVADVVAMAAHNIEARAKLLVPVDTGATKNSIKPSFSPDGLAADIGPSTEYAIYLEMGTRFQAARPFMVPALEAEADAFKKAVRHVVENG